MSETLSLQTAKQAKAATAAGAPKVQTLRETKPKTFAPSALKPLGYGTTDFMTLDVPEGWSFEDVQKSIAWTSVVNAIAADPGKTQPDRVGSLVYVNTADNRFIATLRIQKICRNELKNPCGVETICIGPAIDLKTGRPCPMDLRTGLPWVDPGRPDEPMAA